MAKIDLRKERWPATVQIGNVIKVSTKSGEPIRVGEVTITPQSRALYVTLPFGAYVWNRPVAVVVEWAGLSERVPIVDATRALQLGLVAVSLLFFLGLLISSRKLCGHAGSA